MRPHVPEEGCSFVEANGLRFAYFEEGEGPLVLLVHGFPDTPHTWDDVRPAVAEAGFRVVAPFTRGYAPTQIPDTDDYGSDTLGRDLLALIEALGETSAIVVGHDWGASAAYSAAGLGPDRVRKLVTVGIPHPASLKPSLGKLWGVRHFAVLRFPGAAKRFAKNDFAGLDELYRRWSPTWEIPAAELEAAKNAYAAPGCLHAALGYYRCITAKVPPGQRAKISVPTLCFGGVEDSVVDEADFHAAARRFTGPYEVVMTRGGHFLHREDPKVFLEKLLDYLRSG